MKTKVKVKKILIIIMACIVIGSMIYTVFRINKTKREIEEVVTEIGIDNTEIREGIIKEKSKIKKEEYSKIVGEEIIVIIVNLCGIFIVERKCSI